MCNKICIKRSENKDDNLSNLALGFEGPEFKSDNL